ncbi:hypothetical protein JOC78_000897 [Bacillus ectoiniformans]|uniref:YpoC family protein n=1 Tax=Bacillus ectoiniformans TaxID=1494429 RepID=UPI001958A3A4|nr:hypothetical protein [Bacillus ectoiniformans]MBM7647957.1 hypothetical protein [Bacillus ectoiniformans]
MEKQVPVPLSLQHSLFFNQETAKIPANSSLMEEPYFLYELQVIKGQPWNDREEGLKALDKWWEKIKPELEEKFQARDPLAKHQMKAAIALFFMSLFWLNGEPVQLNDWKSKIFTLSIKPVNVADRLDFIMQRPYSYQAFVQIGELMTEQKKQWAKYNIVKKRKPDGI